MCSFFNDIEKDSEVGEQEKSACNLSDIQAVEVACSFFLCLNFHIPCSKKFSIEMISMVKCDERQELVYFDMINALLKMFLYGLY